MGAAEQQRATEPGAAELRAADDAELVPTHVPPDGHAVDGCSGVARQVLPDGEAVAGERETAGPGERRLGEVDVQPDPGGVEVHAAVGAEHPPRPSRTPRGRSRSAR